MQEGYLYIMDRAKDLIIREPTQCPVIPGHVIPQCAVSQIEFSKRQLIFEYRNCSP